MGFCKICTSPNRAAIDEALAAGQPRRSIARRFGLGDSALEWHARQKHPPAESLADIGDEPEIVEHRGSYDWIVRQARARGKRIEEMLATTRTHDPFYFGSESDVLNARWFADAVVRRFDVQIEAMRAAGVRPHLRGLHYLCVTAPPDNPVKWPDGAVYENTVPDWRRLQDYSRAARWLGFVDIEDFDDQRNAEPEYNAPSEITEDEPSVEVGEWPEWELPRIWTNLDIDEWTIPSIWGFGYDPDPFLDESSLVGVFIEKSTMNGWLRPLCRVLHADLYVGSGIQSITNGGRFVGRAAKMNKAAHLLVISDHDPTGRKMPIGAARHVDYRRRMPGAKCDQWITVDLVALTPEQIDEFHLPRAPIKKTDPGMRRFEKLFGRGAVELDSLEALHPGALEETVREAIDAYRDDDIKQKLSDADESVSDAIQEARAESGIPEIRDKIGKVRAKLDAIVKPIRKELNKLKRKLEARVERIKPELDELRDDLQDEIDAVVEEVEGVLPERPEPELLTGLPDGEEHLFDSERGYFDNLASLHKFYPPDPTPRRKAARRRRRP